MANTTVKELVKRVAMHASQMIDLIRILADDGTKSNGNNRESEKIHCLLYLNQRYS